LKRFKRALLSTSLIGNTDPSKGGGSGVYFATLVPEIAPAPILHALAIGAAARIPGQALGEFIEAIEDLSDHAILLFRCGLLGGKRFFDNVVPGVEDEPILRRWHKMGRRGGPSNSSRCMIIWLAC
jgi:hypothetical protein